MIKNVWKRTQLFCGNHPEPVPLISIAHGELSVRSDYICPLHQPASPENPGGYTEGLEACPTALSFPEAEEIIRQLSLLMEEDSFGVADYTGATFRTKHRIKATVLSYSYKKIDLSIKRDAV